MSNITPYKEDRDYNRTLIRTYGGYIQIHVDTPIDMCKGRNVKGLYTKARAGIIKEFTDISDPFEDPIESEIVLDKNGDIYQNVNMIKEYLRDRDYIV